MVKDILENYPGAHPVILHIQNTGSTLKTSGKYCVAYSDELLEQLKEELGEENVIIK
jgi:hypothetical protein